VDSARGRCRGVGAQRQKQRQRQRRKSMWPVQLISAVKKSCAGSVELSLIRTRGCRFVKIGCRFVRSREIYPRDNPNRT
jgi:hypothetical protein